MSSLHNPCKYSFMNLLEAANEAVDYETLSLLTQKEINIIVKILCKKAGWYYEDVTGKNAIVYTQFSPKLKETYERKE